MVEHEALGIQRRSALVIVLVLRNLAEIMQHAGDLALEAERTLQCQAGLIERGRLRVRRGALEIGPIRRQPARAWLSRLDRRSPRLDLPCNPRHSRRKAKGSFRRRHAPDFVGRCRRGAIRWHLPR